MTRAVVTVVGRDHVGIMARVAEGCAQANANIIDISQTVMNDIFTMVMLVNIQALNCDFDQFVADMKALGDKMNLKIHVMHEDIFSSMHRV
jgi:ACT domain-containing protein